MRKFKTRSQPYIQKVPADELSVIPEGYACVPSVGKNQSKPWSIFRIPQTPEEMSQVIHLTEQYISDQMEFVAECEKTEVQTRLKLLLGLAKHYRKTIGALYERKGELKFSHDAQNIKEDLRACTAVVMARGHKELSVALRKKIGGKKGARIAEFTKSGQERIDRTNIMADFNRRLRENHSKYERSVSGYRSVKTIANDTADAHLNADGRPIMSGSAIYRQHFRSKQAKKNRRK